MPNLKPEERSAEKSMILARRKIVRKNHDEGQ
jgi:hypothetical protein